MTDKLIECIPNFSEGQNPEIIQKIIHTLLSTKNIQVLDKHSDIDHNRTVVTFVGSPEDVQEAAFQVIKVAGELIDLDYHKGSHPRLGATDVLPLVPISGIDINECIQISKTLAEKVGSELNIPVYLYEESALIPERRNLEKIRKGEYELLKNEIQTNPSRKPDFGPSKLTSAGATVIGARYPLIAFNVYLDSTDLEKAKFIAKNIRESSGGLPFVKALGMMVGGLAQVSMNLTNYRETSISKVFSEIIALSEKLNVSVHHSELIGLIPRDALIDSSIETLMLEDFKKFQILENRLEAIPSDRVENTFLDDLASVKPTPGGGSAAAFSGAMAASLVSMVARLTIGKKNYKQVEAQMQEILLQSEKHREELTELVKKDADAFDYVLKAFKLPIGTIILEETRSKAIEDATLYAAKIPLEVAGASLSVLALAEKTVSVGNINTISDGGSAGALAIASIKSAAYNVRINLAYLKKHEPGSSILSKLANIEKRATQLEIQLSTSVVQRGGL